jgi:hypothetical protein
MEMGRKGEWERGRRGEGENGRRGESLIAINNAKRETRNAKR